MLEINVVLFAGIIAILAPTIAIVFKAVNVLRYVEGSLNGLKAEQRLLKNQIDSSLAFLDYRVRDLEKYSEINGNFTTRHRREEQTGAPFLDRD